MRTFGFVFAKSVLNAHCLLKYCSMTAKILTYPGSSMSVATRHVVKL